MKLLEKTIGACFQERVAKTPDGMAVAYRDTAYTWKESDQISDRIALELLGDGIGKGSHMGIWSVNSPNWYFTFLALVKIGAIPVLINTCYKEKELTQILSYADVEYLFYGEEFRQVRYEEVIRRLNRRELPLFKQALSIGAAEEERRRTFLEQPLTEEERRLLGDAKAQVLPGDTAAMLFTSGTTRAPKGVLLTHRSLINNAYEITRQMKWNEEDRMCVAVPLFHCFGVTASVLASIHAGCPMHLMKYYKTKEALEQTSKYRCTILSGVPTMFLAMLYNEERDAYDLSSIRSGIIAGSAISAGEYLKICKTFHFDHLQSSYGQTESSPAITISGYDDSLELKAATAGRKLPGVELRIRDLETGESVPTGVSGEIQSRGYHIMQGYYKMPEQTREALDEDGWLSTGDVGFLDEEGCLHVTGRLKEMIIRGGENISPLEIESVIQEFPGVAQVKVLGIEAKVLQEEIAACIIPKKKSSIDTGELTEFLKERLACYKVPRYILCFEEFPTNASGKIILPELKKQVKEQLQIKQ